MENLYCTTCHNINHPNIKIKHLNLFPNNNKILLIIKNWDTWQHIACSHCSPKMSHLSCKRQYIYDLLKDEGIFCWFFLSSKICCHLQLMSMQLVEYDYWYFSYKCHLQLKISHMDQLQNGRFLLVVATFFGPRHTQIHKKKLNFLKETLTLKMKWREKEKYWQRRKIWNRLKGERQES